MRVLGLIVSATLLTSIAFVINAFPAGAFHLSPTISTDRAEYVVGGTVVITGNVGAVLTEEPWICSEDGTLLIETTNAHGELFDSQTICPDPFSGSWSHAVILAGDSATEGKWSAVAKVGKGEAEISFQVKE